MPAQANAGTGGGDLQLLVGVMAAQLGLASPQEVLAAAGAWAAERGAGLAEHLERQGVLDRTRREMLEGMAALAVRAHGGDAAATLGALGGPGAVVSSLGGDGAAARSLTTSLEASLVLAPSGPGAVSPGPAPATPSLAGVTAESTGRYRPRSGEGAAAEIGRGGIGRVLLVIDEHLGREVALKELLSGGLGPPGTSGAQSAAVLARFLREARVTGQLEHPGIVPVYELGQRADGKLYYTMRFVRGRTLGRALREAGGLADRLELLTHFAALCQAVAYAHSRGVVHRDLKPDNVMIGEFGETVLLDWGLAKVRGQADPRGQELARQIQLLQEGAVGQTVEGQAVGTPLTMSPEQAEGRLELVDERSDVWSLGVILFEILCGRPPFQGFSPFEVMGKVLREPVPRVRALSPRAPAELAAIAEKALDRQRAGRHADAGALAREVEAYLTGGRVQSYAYSSWDLLVRFARRNKLATAALAGLFVVIAVALGVVWAALGERTAALATSDAARAEEREARLLAEANLAQALAAQAKRHVKDGRYAEARIFAAGALVRHPANPEGEQFDAAFAAAHPEALRVLADARGALARADIEPRPALLREVQTSAATFPETGAFSPDGSLLVLSDDSGALRAIRIADGTEVWHQQLSIDRRYPVFSPNGTVLAHGGDRVSLRDASNGALLTELPENSSSMVGRLGFSPDGRSLVVADDGGVLRLWDLEARKVKWSGADLGTRVLSVLFSPDGLHIGCTTQMGRVALIDANTGRTTPLDAQCSPLRSCSLLFSPDSSRLATLDGSHQLELWSVADGSTIGSLDPQARDLVRRCTLGRPGDEIVPSCKGAQGWLRPLLELDRIPLPAFDSRPNWHPRPSGLLLAMERSRMTGKRIFAWTFPEVASSADLGQTVNNARIDPTGRTVALFLGGHPEVVFLERTSLTRLPGPTSKDAPEVTGGCWPPAAFRLDGNLVLWAGQDGVLRTWDLRADRALPSIKVQRKGICDLAITRDDRRLATAGSDGTVTLSDVPSGAQLLSLEHGDVVFGLAFTADGLRVATACRDGLVRIFSAEGGELLHRFKTLSSPALHLDFSPDGSLIASGEDAGWIQVHELATGRRLRVLGPMKRQAAG